MGIRFAVLVQKEWAELGHKFEDRLYSGTDEQSPVFLQFLDAVFQLTQQFPTVRIVSSPTMLCI